jgi:hypothetical protein
MELPRKPLCAQHEVRGEQRNPQQARRCSVDQILMKSSLDQARVCPKMVVLCMPIEGFGRLERSENQAPSQEVERLPWGLG